LISGRDGALRLSGCEQQRGRRRFSAKFASS
jgi:hypothetical protein